MKYLIANWKAQMTLPLIISWANEFRSLVDNNKLVTSALNKKVLEIIICPPSPFILYLKKHLEELSGIRIGSQSLSPKEHGKYTGEVTAEALSGIVDYAIIGHSERRSHFNESEKVIKSQIDRAKENGIKQILCVRNTEDQIYEGVDIVAYEPTEAIGTGANAAACDVLGMKHKLSFSKKTSFLYGGSADDTNMTEYLYTNEVDGLLVGTASLDPNKFFAMALKMLE